MNLRQRTISKTLQKLLYHRPEAFVKTLMQNNWRKEIYRTWKIEKFWWTRGFSIRE